MKNIFDALQAIGFLSKWKRKFLNQKYIVVIVGHTGIFLSAFINDKNISSLFVSIQDDSINLESYKNFLKQFKKYKVFFVLDDASCKMRHDSIPILQSISKKDNVSQFINKYFNKDDIITHYVYDVSTNPSEVWSTLIISNPCTPLLTSIIEYIFRNNSFYFRGIYFLSLEFSIMVDKIILDAKKRQYVKHIQICVFILQASGIKIIIKHRNNILIVRNIEYPIDKSDSYIQGIIEQEINNSLASLKDHLTILKDKICIIFIVDAHLENLLSQVNFSNHVKIFISPESLLNESNLRSGRFLDSNISQLLIKHKNFPASSNYLKLIKKLQDIRAITFRLGNLIIFISLIIAGTVKYNVSKNNKTSAVLHEEYYATNREYDEIKRKYPYINHYINLADVYVVETFLKIPTALPFELLGKLISIIPSSFELQKITWELTNTDNILLISRQHPKIKILLRYTTHNISIDDSTKLLNEHINELQKQLGDDLTINSSIYHDRIVSIMGRVLIPLSITIDNKG